MIRGVAAQREAARLAGDPVPVDSEAWQLCRAWFDALIGQMQLVHLKRYVDEAIAAIFIEEGLKYRSSNIDMEVSVEGLLGQHKLIENQKLNFVQRFVVGSIDF